MKDTDLLQIMFKLIVLNGGITPKIGAIFFWEGNNFWITLYIHLSIQVLEVWNLWSASVF